MRYDFTKGYSFSCVQFFSSNFPVSLSTKNMELYRDNYKDLKCEKKDLQTK